MYIYILYWKKGGEKTSSYSYSGYSFSRICKTISASWEFGDAMASLLEDAFGAQDKGAMFFRGNWDPYLYRVDGPIVWVPTLVGLSKTMRVCHGFCFFAFCFFALGPKTNEQWNKGSWLFRVYIGDEILSRYSKVCFVAQISSELIYPPGNGSSISHLRKFGKSSIQRVSTNGRGYPLVFRFVYIHPIPTWKR